MIKKSALFCILLSQTCYGGGLSSRYPSNLIALYKFDEGSGATYRNDAPSHPNKLDQLSGCGAGQAWVTGKFATGVNFSGTNGAIRATAPAAFAILNYTVMAWVKMRVISAASDGGIYKTGTSPYWGLNINSARLQSSNSSDGEDLGTIFIATGVWTHVAVVRDTTNAASGIRMFVNGKLDTTAPSNSDTITPNNSTYVVGAVNTTCADELKGSLDDVAVFDRALSDGEIADVYMQGSGRMGSQEW